MEVWKIIFLSKWVICRFHVNLPGCTRVPGNVVDPCGFVMICGCNTYYCPYPLILDFFVRGGQKL